MAEKGENKILVIITVCIMLITIGFSGCIGDDNKIESTYHIKIENIDSNFTIVIPLPVDDNGYINKLIEKLEFNKGSGEFEIINTTYGRDKIGLKIKSNNDIELKSSCSLKTLYRLSLENRTGNNDEWYEENPEWFVYFESEQETQIYIEIRYDLDQTSKMDGFATWGNIIRGLNSVEGKKLIRRD